MLFVSSRNASLYDDHHHALSFSSLHGDRRPGGRTRRRSAEEDGRPGSIRHQVLGRVATVWTPLLLMWMAVSLLHTSTTRGGRHTTVILSGVQAWAGPALGSTHSFFFTSPRPRSGGVARFPSPARGRHGLAASQLIDDVTLDVLPSGRASLSSTSTTTTTTLSLPVSISPTLECNNPLLDLRPWPSTTPMRGSSGPAPLRMFLTMPDSPGVLPRASSWGSASSRASSSSSSSPSMDNTATLPSFSRRQIPRGVLGFALDDFSSWVDSPSHHHDTKGPDRPSSSVLSASRLSNVDSTAWNVPDSWATSGRHSGEGPPEQPPPPGWTPNDMFWKEQSSRAEGSTLGGSKRLSSTSTAWNLPWIPSPAQIQSLTVDDLKHLCTDRGLTASGKKADLQARLTAWTQHQKEASRHRIQRESSSLDLFQAYGVDSSSEARALALENDLFQDLHLFDQEPERRPIKTDTNDRSSTPNSLAEWARTVDLEPLLHRREAIHREKLQGKSVPSRPTVPTTTSPDEFREILQKVFAQPSSPYSNREVKQMYAAAKHADQTGDRELSKRILVELKQATPHDARVFRRLARMEKEEGNYAQARAILHEGLQLNEDNAFLWHGLGQLAETYDEAKKYWQRAIEADPTLPHAHHALGTMEHTQGRIANAMSTLKKGLDYCPTNHRLHHGLGDLYRDAKMLDMAERSYRNALKHGPSVSHGFAFAALSYVAYEKGEVEQCRKWLQNAIKVNDGRHANGWVALAQFEESEGNIDAARAACASGLALYERGLLERSGNVHMKRSPVNRALLEDPIALKNEFLRSVPEYRSGDRFYNVYRNWARLEERYGDHASVDEVYQRATAAFPAEWKMIIEYAQYNVKIGMHRRARMLFGAACSKAGHLHAEAYRIFGEYEMSHGKYEAARKILYAGALALSRAESVGPGDNLARAEFFHTWAVCEWHLGELSRADVLLEKALRLTDKSSEFAKLRSVILYSTAKLEYFRNEHIRAQHFLALCLQENHFPGGNSAVWELWSKLATEQGNAVLANQCDIQAARARASETEEGPLGSMRFVSSAGSSSGGTLPLEPGSRSPGSQMEGWVRRDPWHHKLFGVVPPASSPFAGVRLPEKPSDADLPAPWPSREATMVEPIQN